MATYFYLTGDDNANNVYGDDNANVVRGGGGNDIVRGGDGDDRMSGGQGDDAMSGGGGNDYMFGGKGNDLINGGRGDDTADYTGSRSDYTFSVDRLGRLHITDLRPGHDGADILQNIEHIHFQTGNETYDVVNNQVVPHTTSHPDIISA